MLRRAPAILLILSCFGGLAHAQDESAESIVRRMVRTDALTWEGARTRLRMVLSDPSGERKERTMEVVAKRKDGLFRTLVRFLSPDNIAGTAFLMLERKGQRSEQYVYLSGLKRTRRIVGREAEGSFMGSDFTYADMQRLDAKHATHKRLPDEELSGAPVYVIESTVNKGAPSSYSRVVSWVRKSDLIALRTRFYDKQGKHLKTLYTRRVKQMDGKPVVMEARMQSKQTGHATDLAVLSLEPDVELPDSLFTPNALERF